MKIAVASDNKNVTQHFGHCETFEVFEIEDKKIINEVSIPNPGHKPGFLPNFLNEKGICMIISGGMGQGAVDIFNQHNIDVIVGASGSSKAVVEAYLSGELTSTGSVCNEHNH